MADVAFAGICVAVVNSAITLANRYADINERKEQFMQGVALGLSANGNNATVICTRHSAAGYDHVTNHRFEGETYWIYAASNDHVMAVENLGDRGWHKWQNSGVNWIRWGNLNHFHDHWDGGMGTPGERRDRNAYPHQEWFNQNKITTRGDYFGRT